MKNEIRERIISISHKKNLNRNFLIPLTLSSIVFISNILENYTLLYTIWAIACVICCVFWRAFRVIRETDMEIIKKNKLINVVLAYGGFEFYITYFLLLILVKFINSSNFINDPFISFSLVSFFIIMTIFIDGKIANFYRKKIIK